MEVAKYKIYLDVYRPVGWEFLKNHYKEIDLGQIGG